MSAHAIDYFHQTICASFVSELHFAEVALSERKRAVHALPSKFRARVPPRASASILGASIQRRKTQRSFCKNRHAIPHNKEKVVMEKNTNLKLQAGHLVAGDPRPQS